MVSSMKTNMQFPDNPAICAAVFIFNEDKDVLIAERMAKRGITDSNKQNDIVYCIPGGKQDYGETLLHTAW